MVQTPHVFIWYWTGFKFYCLSILFFLLPVNSTYQLSTIAKILRAAQLSHFKN